MSEIHNFSVLGLPGSGKTTFFAALWDGLSRPSAESALRLETLPPERKYLTEIHERWLRCEPTPYTRLGQGVSSATLNLADVAGTSFELVIPDVAGEAYNELWEKRTWTDGLQDVSRAASGFLVFIHASAIVAMHPLVVDAEPTREHGDEVGDPEAPNPWNPATAPTQVKVIDLIQSVRALHRDSTLPLAVVLSAWDTVEAQGVAPSDYLRLQMPMLWQFLQTNDGLEHSVFGLSAQGGDVASSDEADRLRKVAPPSARVMVFEPDGISSDISRPLIWLLERDSR